MSKVFVGGLSYRTTEDSLRNYFGQVGTVTSARIITDRETGRSRGFGFVEMGSSAEAESAIAQLDGKELDERVIRVSIANETGGGRSGGPRSHGNGNGHGRAGFGGRSNGRGNGGHGGGPGRGGDYGNDY
jgi:RNA recognition motif-containing protein